MPRYSYGTQKIIDQLQWELDRIEMRWPMTGSYERIDPYIVPLMQADEWFELIVYHVASKLWFDKSWTDRPTLEVKSRGLIKPGSVSFDLGCNSGSITIPMAMQAGPDGHVHAFDPYPWNAAATQASAKLNHLFNVTAHPVGLSNKTHSIDVSPNDSRIYAPSNDVASQKLDIRHIREFMHFNPSFLKIDIEGAEHDLFDVDDRRLYGCVENAMLEFHPMWITPRGIDCRETLRNIVKAGFHLRYYSPDSADYDIENFVDHHHLFWLARRE